MRTRLIIALLTILILAIGITLSSSNMGFKISFSLVANRQKVVSLPYYNNYTNAASLRNDIVNAGGTGVAVYNYNGTSWQRYAGGGPGQINFNINPSLGYMVVSTTDVSNWIVVGSHNPNLTISLTANQQKVISVPYHTTLTTAAQLRNEFNVLGGTGVAVYNYNGSTWQRYAGGGPGQVNFSLTPGLAYMVVSTTNTSPWLPPHY